MADKTEERPQKSIRVFINNVDNYTTKHIAKFLDSCVVGASLVDFEADVEEEEDRLQDDKQTKIKDATFQIVGTVSSQTEKCSFISEEYSHLKHEELLRHLMKCDVIIFDINQHADQIAEAQWAVSALHKEMDTFSGHKIFILVSTIMTWAMSKPANKDDPEIPFTDEHYRKRKAHPNFCDHIELEKLVVKLGKTKSSLFSTYVVASGLQYGMGEHMFHLFFKMSWLGEVSEVPIFGDGSNIIPTIHINDLAGIIQNVIDHKPKSQYIVAVDDSKNTMDDIIKAITLVLGPGKTRNVSKEEIYLIRELTQTDIDSLFVNLRIEALYLKENFNIQWVSEYGMVENIEQITEEYKQTRRLLPLRICILGPPAVGKSTIAERICKHYKLHHVKLKETITETLNNLESCIQMEDMENDEGETQEFLDTLKENMNENGGRLDDQYVIRIMRDKLRTKPCLNQGFVLDGFPKTYELAKQLFTGDEEPEDLQSKHEKKIIPEFVFSVDATDDFLKNRVLNLPETVVEGTSYTPEQFPRHLARFRERNVEDQTVLNFFEDLEIDLEHLEITSNDDNEYLLVTEKICKKVGKPKNYRPISEEVEEEERRQAEQQLKKQATQKAEAERQEEEEAQQRDQRWGEWNQSLQEVRREEHDLLESQSVPLRNYLMRDVMPTLTQGLIQCSTIRPDDPIDFLAEYLLKNNPEA
ncbi:adenylate kinase 7 isoform X3 [Pimephales promelas]|uniref:adenylate kinase 7 isoform X3 n=1 Tax=Pimephales promelas TaxID=90988 RepID=UPI001955933B|nr:adenylate kinase 7 isoform X3 [Pimephales promelas]KAG1972890.1 adenylate kinase [Pimephales promelas]